MVQGGTGKSVYPVDIFAISRQFATNMYGRYMIGSGGALMELGVVELSLIILTAVSVLALAFTLAWLDASPRKQARGALDQMPK